MKKMIGITVTVVVLFCFQVVFANTAEDIKALNLAGAETLLFSDSVECHQKKQVSRHVSLTTRQELFHRLGGVDNSQNNFILLKTRRVNDLMNQVFAKEGVHQWSKDDPRVLGLAWAFWTESNNPACFDEKTNGFSSEEWLMGALWAMRQK
ncbi:MAG: hypothetical protein U9Q12_04125 [Patescibacteria group bacterium]|nr:hypothetical protein [Patescibacteria group bacterium]